MIQCARFDDLSCPTDHINAAQPQDKKAALSFDE